MKTLGAGASGRGFKIRRLLFLKAHQHIPLNYCSAIVLLTLATVFWGFGNVAQKIALNDLSPIMLLLIRSSIALLCLAPLAVWECRHKKITRQRIYSHWRLFLGTGVSFAMGLASQTFAGQFTSATNLGFIINLCVLITPLLLFIVIGERISKLTLLSCFICFIGACLLTGLHLQKPNFGDGLCLLGAFFYAVWIIALDRTLKAIDAPILITALQFIPVSVVGLVLGLSEQEIFKIDMVRVWPALLFVSILSTSVSFLIAAYAQRLVTPVVAGIVYSFEALFGAIAAFVVLGERLSASAMLGGSLMFASIIVCQYRASTLQTARPVCVPSSKDELHSWLIRLNVWRESRKF